MALQASRSADKWRAQRGLVTTLHVFLNTSPFELNFVSASTTAQLLYPTDDVRFIAALARRTVAQLYRLGHTLSTTQKNPSEEGLGFKRPAVWPVPSRPTRHRY